jgi:hypothetical protein
LAPLAGSVTFFSVTLSWVPLLSLTPRVDPRGPELLLAGAGLGEVVPPALVPGLADAVPAVLAVGLAVAVVAWGLAAVVARCVLAGCGGDGEHAANTRTAAVTAPAAQGTPHALGLRVKA